MKSKKKILVFLLFYFFSLTAHALSQEIRTLEGRVEILIFDNFEENTSETKVFLYEEGSSLTLGLEEGVQLEFEGELPNFKSGQKIKVHCLEETGKVCPVLKWEERELSTKELPKMTGSMKVAWIIADVNDVDVGLTETEAQDRIEMTDNWFKQASFNQLEINKDVDENGTYDLFRIKVEDYTKAENGCDFVELGKRATALLEDQGVDFSIYHYKLFFIPKLSCGFGGVAYMSCGTDCRAYVQSVNWNLVYPHELGHNIGQHHAATDPENDGTYNSEYGDGTCPMGNKLSKGFFNAPHSIHLGWLTEENGEVTTINGSEESYSLPLMGEESSLPRIYHFTREGRNYYLSYRTQNEFDQLATSYTNGINFYFADGAGKRTYFIKTIAAGETFQGPNFSVTTTSVTDTEAQFNLNFCDVRPKLSRQTPYVRVGEGESVDLTFTIKSNEDEACSDQSYTLEPILEGLEGSLSQSEIVVAPGSSQNITLTVTLPAEPKEYTLGLQATSVTNGSTASKTTQVLASSSDENFQPKIAREFYKGAWLSLPGFEGLTPSRIEFHDKLTFIPTGGPSRFGLRYRGFLKLEPGTYTFHLDSDDGSLIKLGRTGLVSHDGLNEMGTPKTRNYKATETSFVPFEVQYFNYDGSRGLEVLISKDGGEFEEISPELIYHFAPAYTKDESVMSYLQIESDAVESGDDTFTAYLPGCYTSAIPFVKAQTSRGASPFTLEASYGGCTGEGKSIVKINMREFDYLDGAHTAEVLGILLVREGFFELSDGSFVEATRHSVSSETGTTITLRDIFSQEESFFLSQVLTKEEEHARLSRIFPGTYSKVMKLRLQAEEKLNKAGTQSHSEVGFLRFKASPNSSILPRKIPTSQEWLKVIFSGNNSYQSTYFTESVTMNGWDPAYAGAHRDGVNAIKIKMNEEKSFDTELWHDYENINILYIPGIEGTFTGTEAE